MSSVIRGRRAMRHPVIQVLVLCLACWAAPVAAAPDIEALLQRMTLEEKTGQMTMIALNAVTRGEGLYEPAEPHALDMERLRRTIVEHHAGCLFNIATHGFPPAHWRTIIGAMQHMAMHETRLGIPLIYGLDALHGMHLAHGATIFPHQIGLAASWNPALVHQTAQVTAAEARAVSVPWLYAPAAEPGRNPVHARFYESFGEDTLLAAELTTATVAGYRAQGPNGRVAATLKHYAGYSAPVSGRDRTTAELTERELREHYLPPFAAGIRAGAESIMLNLSDVAGVPVHGDRRLIQEVLKEELGFTGVVVSDWSAVDYLHGHHHVAASPDEAIALAITAGVDMVMVPFDHAFPAQLAELVRQGRVSRTRIDDAVRRILWLKVELGLFEHGGLASRPPPPIGDPAARALARQAATQSLVLLKNDKATLPLSPQSRLLVTGPAADSIAMLHGGWSDTWQGPAADASVQPGGPSIVQALRARLGEARVLFAPTPGKEADEGERAGRLAAEADAVVLCLGEGPYAEIFGNIDDLTLPRPQLELAERLAAVGRPVILVLVEGRPRIITEIEQSMAAVLLAPLPGDEGGAALSDVLVGEAEPGGRLPFTYPAGPNALMTYDHRHSEEYAFARLYPFGHGLSYTTFDYEALRIDRDRLGCGDRLVVEVTVRNTGRRPGQEVAQLYVSDHFASIAPPIKRLRAFEKVWLRPGESRRLVFSISPRELTFVDRDNHSIAEAGSFSALVGDLRQDFTLTEDCRH